MSIYIKDIEPINEVGRNLIDAQNIDEIIDAIIELPFRKICKILSQKGIESVMSSANKNNILKPGEKRKEKEDVYGSGQQWLYPRPMYDDAGCGYAWIMLNFDTLSDENKDILFALEETVDKNGNKIGQNVIWFVHPYEMGNLEYDLRCGKHTYEGLSKILSKNEMPQGIEYDPKLAEFEKRHIVLGYNGGIYPEQSVFLRMPIDEETTVDELERYFEKMISVFQIQTKDINKTSRKRKKGDKEVEFV